jgi:hypothetical protein
MQIRKAERLGSTGNVREREVSPESEVLAGVTLFARLILHHL